MPKIFLYEIIVTEFNNILYYIIDVHDLRKILRYLIKAPADYIKKKCPLQKVLTTPLLIANNHHKCNTKVKISA